MKERTSIRSTVYTSIPFNDGLHRLGPSRRFLLLNRRSYKSMPAVKQAKLPNAPSSDEKKSTDGPNGYPPKNGRQNGREPRPSPNAFVRLWRTIKAIYYASAPSWQMLKSGALFFFGFFCWSSANLLLSYEPSWHWTYVLMAYGFLLTWYGPFTHLVLVPHVIPWLRRCKRGTSLHWLGKQLTPINLTIFFTAVVLMGLFPPNVMTFDFRSIVQETRTVEVNPTLECTRDASTITCWLDNAEGVGSITVTSGGTQLLERQAGDLTFSVEERELVQVVGQRQFQVVVYTPDGTPARRFTQTVSMIR